LSKCQLSVIKNAQFYNIKKRQIYENYKTTLPKSVLVIYQIPKGLTDHLHTAY